MAGYLLVGPWWVPCVLLSSLIAGSQGDPVGPATPEPETTPTNRPPVASVAANSTTGTAPMAVAFSLEGSDPDGDPLAWRLDHDGDGTRQAAGDGLPASVEAWFEEGNHTVVLLVDDGQVTVEDRLRLTVEAPPPTLEEHDGSIIGASLAGCGAGYRPAESDGVPHGLVVIDPKTIGMTFYPAFFILAGFSGSIYVDFLDADRILMESHQASSYEVRGQVVPAQAASMAVVFCQGAGLDWTVAVVDLPPELR